jgi:hypothetical protein
MRWVRTCALEALPVSWPFAKVSYAADMRVNLASLQSLHAYSIYG